MLTIIFTMNYQCYLRRVVDRNEGLGAPPVVAVLARHLCLPLRLLFHEDLVDTPDDKHSF